MKSFEKKIEIMKTKNKLKNISIYLESDLTPKEIKTGKKIMEIAKEENKWGIRYHKLTTNNSTYVWDKKITALPKWERKIVKHRRTRAARVTTRQWKTDTNIGNGIEKIH